MNKWLFTIISSVIFFGIYIILECIFSESIDWKMAIIMTVMYVVLQICIKIFEVRKLKK